MNVLNILLIINILVCSVTASKEIDEIISKLRIKIYTGSSIDSATTVDVPVNESDIIYQNIDNTKPVVLYIHGFIEKPSDESVRTVIGAYLRRGTDNIFLVDWSDLAFQEYFSLIPKVEKMGEIIAKTFDRIFELGLNLDTFHIVSHSMGVPMAGSIGKNSINVLPRITGLDPTGPGYDPPLTTDHLNSENAKFVDIIHTDIGVIGITKTDGTADFFANGGKRPQPGCPLIVSLQDPLSKCSHQKSWRIYAESVINPHAFVAVKCPSYRDFSKGKCKDNNFVYYGYSTSKTARGFYFFNTKKPDLTKKLLNNL